LAIRPENQGKLMPAEYLVSVVGPTALGKTRLAIALARHFNTEILSADSRQFYKEMAIGTAVPSASDLKAVPHHFVQHIGIHQSYSVGDFEREGLACLHKLFNRHQLVIMAGGSGLYINALTLGLDSFPKASRGIRKALQETLEKEGLGPLQEQLQELDPDYYDTVDLQNPQRLIRALEVAIACGQPYSSFLKGNRASRPFSVLTLGLEAPRELLYERINSRVDQMVANGLLEEARGLFAFRNLNALNTVGYKEMFSYLEGHMDFDTAVAEIKKNTRRFAKRQLTWFRKQPEIHWIDFRLPPQKAIEIIENNIHERG